MDMRASDARGVVEKARAEGTTWREARREANILGVGVGAGGGGGGGRWNWFGGVMVGGLRVYKTFQRRCVLRSECARSISRYACAKTIL